MNRANNSPDLRRHVVPHVQNMAAPNEQSLGRAEARPSEFEITNPREIEVHIEELVLHGFDPHARWNIGDAIEQELRGLLMEKGLPSAWRHGSERLEANPITVAHLGKPATTGQQIARAVCKAVAK